MVQQGDVLSRIARKTLGHPIYGTDGTLNRLLSMNSSVENANQIFPGDQLVISKEDEARGKLTSKSKKHDRVPSTVGDDAKTADTNSCAPNTADAARTASRTIASEQADDIVTSAFRMGVGLDFFRLDGHDTVNGGNTKILSNAVPRLDLAYAMKWTDTTAFTLGASVERYSLMPFSSTYGYDSNSGARARFGLGVLQQITPQLQGQLNVNFGQELFLRASNLTTLSVDSVMIVEPELRFNYAILSKKNAQIGVIGGWMYLAPSSTSFYDINSGYLYEFGLYFKNESYPEADKGFYGEVLYQHQNQDTSIFSKSFTDLRFMISYFWKLNF